MVAHMPQNGMYAPPAVVSPTTTVLGLDYDFSLGAANNGNVMSITNTVTPGRTQTFTYDQLDRIATAKTQATTGSLCWGQIFAIDIWANLTGITVPSTHTSCTVQ